MSMAIAGAAVGAFLGGLISDLIGRKKTLIVSDIFFSVGAAFMGFAGDILMMIFGRFVVGLGIGVAAMGVPVYLAECSPHEIRGAMVSMNNFMITFGLLSSYAIGY